MPGDGAATPGLPAGAGREERPLGELREEMAREQSWLERVAMNGRASGYGRLTCDDVRRRLDEFFRLLENAGTTHKTRRDARSHFAHWLRRELMRERGAAAPRGGAGDGGDVGRILHDDAPGRFRQEDLW